MKVTMTLLKGCAALAVLLLASCASQKQITYLQGASTHESEPINQVYEIRIQPDDLLSIAVNSKDMDAVQMFNLPQVNYYLGSQTGIQQSNGRGLGYQVDQNGNIEFPRLGTLHVAGMTRSELSRYIQSQLVDGQLLGDAIVTVQFLNLKISVLGEVTRPGSFELNSDRISLFDAISRAGDLTIYGRRDNVKLIREEDGRRIVAELDLRSSDILESPYYYLKQNDVLYVEPNTARAGQREINQNRSIGTFASIVSVLISIAVLIWR
ncbi:MAG: polysaccharide biosynthesis/export family protein [Prevotellaceae bacterium]|jgi:polysaccharide export outer membrane protein|nr:polysaccharide biosynthesis/export family protein [Prevotellaceae bacterium]